jgi:hypothetical protein
LVARLALAEAEIEKLRVAATFANEAAKRATTAAAAAEATTRDAAQTASREKAALETKVTDLERDLAIAGVDLAMANCQFSQVAKPALGGLRGGDAAAGGQSQVVGGP